MPSITVAQTLARSSSRHATPLEAATDLLVHVAISSDNIASSLGDDADRIAGIAASIDLAYHAKLDFCPIEGLCDLLKVVAESMRESARDLADLGRAHEFAKGLQSPGSAERGQA
jgi:hypothetical protein